MSDGEPTGHVPEPMKILTRLASLVWTMGFHSGKTSEIPVDLSKDRKGRPQRLTQWIWGGWQTSVPVRMLHSWLWHAAQVSESLNHLHLHFNKTTAFTSQPGITPTISLICSYMCTTQVNHTKFSTVSTRNGPISVYSWKSSSSQLALLPFPRTAVCTLSFPFFFLSDPYLPDTSFYVGGFTSYFIMETN